MKRFIIALSCALCACSFNTISVDEEEYDQLKSELLACRRELNELKNTPQAMLIQAQQYQREGADSTAKEAYRALIEKHPDVEESTRAGALLSELEAAEKAKREAEERKRSLGFKSLKESTTITVGDVTMNFSSVKSTDRWIFDRYDNRWHYLSPERDNTYIVGDLSISSETKNPDLPAVELYKLNAGQLERLGVMRYEFHKWSDYGYYLGNYHDKRNDFAYTKTIQFSVGIEVLKDDFNNSVIFVVVKNSNCVVREGDRYGRPPVKYVSKCGIATSLTVDDFDEDYILVKVFNKNKL